jgi:hypothetical protein
VRLHAATERRAIAFANAEKRGLAGEGERLIADP